MRLSSVALVLLATACSSLPHGEPLTGARPRVVRKVEQPPPVPAFHWEPVEVSIDPSVTRTSLPLAASDVAFLGRAERTFLALSEPAQRAVLSRGFAVFSGSTTPATMGALYRELETAELPIVVTLDALGEVVHAALAAALAEVERTVLEPTIGRVLARIGERFERMSAEPGTTTDLGRALRMARGIVAVSTVLLDPKKAVAADLELEVREEVRRVQAARGPQVSLLLGVPMDYSIARTASRVPPERRGFVSMLAWLAAAPLMLVGRDEALGPPLSVMRVRDQTRAALLFAHALHPRVDAEASAAWERVESIERFLIGPSDDWSPIDLAALGAAERIDVTDPRTFEVSRVDRLRRAASRSFRARIHDGGGSLASMDSESTPRELRESRFVSRFVPPTVRVLGARVGLDAVIQQALVHPVIGPYRGSSSVTTLDSGRRTLPRALDFAAVLGSSEARDALRSEGDDAYDDFDTTLRKLVDRKPPEREATRHASVYLSALDLVATLLSPSAADASVPAASSAEYKRRALEVGLAMYASIRHDFDGPGRPMPTAPAFTAGPPRPSSGDNRATRVLVEPHPEAIGRMLALVRQLARGLGAYRALAPEGAALRVLKNAERVLNLAFQAALLMANDVAPNDEQSRALRTMVHDIEALELATGTATARVVDMHADLSGKRVLAQGTGAPETIALVMRDPAAKEGALVLAFGAASRHFEVVRPSAEKLGDAEWRARLSKGSVVAPAWSAGFHFTRPKPSEVNTEAGSKSPAEAD